MQAFFAPFCLSQNSPLNDGAKANNLKKHLTPLTPLTPNAAYLDASKASLAHIYARQEAPVIPAEPPEKNSQPGNFPTEPPDIRKQPSVIGKQPPVIRKQAPVG